MLEYDFQTRGKTRPESAKLRPNNNKKLPYVRPSSAAVKQHIKPTQEVLEEEFEEAMNSYAKPAIDYNAIFLQPPSQNQNRKLPKDIKKDKEQMYEEQLDLKQQVLLLKEENTRLKTKNQAMQKENVKLEKLLNTCDSGRGQMSDHILMNNLKKSMKELKAQLQEKEGELVTIKKQIKVTKIQEIESELRNYIEESIRLRTLLDQTQRNLIAQRNITQLDHVEEKLYVHLKIINSLKQEIDQFQGVQKLKDEELFNLQVRCEQFEIMRLKAEEHSNNLQAELDEQNIKIGQVQSELLNLKTINNNLIIKATRTHNDDTRIRELEQLNDELRMIIMERDQQIGDLHHQLSDMKLNYQDSFNHLERERKHFENEMEYFKTQYEQLEDKYKLLQQSNQQESQEELVHSRSDRRVSTRLLPKPSQSHIQINEQRKSILPQSIPVPVEQHPRPSSAVLKRRRTVKQDDIKDLALELCQSFRLKKLQVAQIIENDLFDLEISQKGVISIKDIAVRLSDSPFDLKDVEQIYLLARYLVEDNSQDYVDFDENRTQTLSVVRSIFKQLIGNYKLFSKEQETTLTQEIRQQVMKYKRSIISYLPTLNQPQLTKDTIMKAFNFMQIQLSNDAWDYFFLKLYQLGQNCKKFDYKLITDEWGQEDHCNLSILCRKAHFRAYQKQVQSMNYNCYQFKCISYESSKQLILVKQWDQLI